MKACPPRSCVRLCLGDWILHSSCQSFHLAIQSFSSRKKKNLLSFVGWFPLLNLFHSPSAIPIFHFLIFLNLSTNSLMSSILYLQSIYTSLCALGQCLNSIFRTIIQVSVEIFLFFIYILNCIVVKNHVWVPKMLSFFSSVHVRLPQKLCFSWDGFYLLWLIF